MKTERATMTALRGGSISEESFAISTAIFAAPYVALQTDSFDDSGSLGGSQEGEPMDRAMALEKAASALRSLVREWNVTSSCVMYLAICGVGVRGGVVGDEGFFRGKSMVNVRTTAYRSPSPGIHSALGCLVMRSGPLDFDACGTGHGAPDASVALVGRRWRLLEW